MKKLLIFLLILTVLVLAETAFVTWIHPAASPQEYMKSNGIDSTSKATVHD